MAEFGATHPQFRARLVRWRIETALCGAAAVLVPGVAHAASRPYRLTPPTVQVAHPLLDAVRLSIADQPPALADPGFATLRHDADGIGLNVALPEDLTRIPVRAAAIPAAAGNGYVHDGDVTTSGDNMPGIVVDTPGDAQIIAGTVTTSGANSDGVDVYAGGSASIQLSGVNTSGDGSRGIYAAAGDNISIDAGSIYDSGGLGIGGINARSTSGDVDINVADVTTVSPNPTVAIYAGGHDVHITAGNVTAYTNKLARTVGIYAHGASAGADVSVTIDGSLYSHGSRADGLTILSDGTVEVVNNGAIRLGQLAGNKSTTAGIDVYAQDGISIENNGTITSDSKGILAHSTAVDIVISSAGNIVAYQDGITASTMNLVYAGGYYQGGNYLAPGGDVTIDAGNVAGGGVTGNAISAAARNVDISISGAASSIHGNGVVARGYGGDVTIHNDGSVYGRYTGIDAAAYGSVTIDGSGTVESPTVAIAAQSIGGSVAITEGDVSGTIDAEADLRAGDGVGDPSRALAIDVGNVSSRVSYHSAIIGSNQNEGAVTSIDAGDLTTYGDVSAGAVVFSNNGTVDLTADSVTTKGINSTGVFVEGALDSNVSIANVATGNIGAAGIQVAGPYSASGSVVVDAGSVATLGDSADGIIVRGDADIKLTAGSVATSGAGALGISVGALGSANAIDINAGTVTTTGDQASGIVAFGAEYQTDPITIDAGTVTTSGENSAGIVAATYNSAVAVKAGAVSVAGAGAPGVLVYSLGGTADVDVGMVSSAGIKAPAIMVQGDTGATVTAGNVSTSGYVSNGVVVRSGSAGVDAKGSITVGSVSTTGNVTSAIDALAVGDADHVSTMAINAGTITTSGQDAVGIAATADYGQLDIKAGSITTKGAESVGILASGGAGMNLQVGSIKSVAQSIYAFGSGNGAMTLNVSGAVNSSDYSAVELRNVDGMTAVSVANGGSISGGNDAIAVQSGGGRVNIDNAGTITDGSGYAIDIGGLQERVPGSSTPAAIIDARGHHRQPGSLDRQQRHDRRRGSACRRRRRADQQRSVLRHEGQRVRRRRRPVRQRRDGRFGQGLRAAGGEVCEPRELPQRRRFDQPRSR